MHIHKVLVPVDFSPPSTLAVNHGIALARKFRARLSLLHVVESPSAVLYTFPIEANNIERQRIEQAEKMLPALVGSEDQDDLDVRFIVRAGNIDEVIESVLKEEQADAIVIGTHGRTLFGRLLIGSVTQGLLRRVAVPVLTVCHVSRPLEFKRILFATDLGPNSEQAFHFALDMASETRSDLVVGHVIDKRPVITYETPEIRNVFDEDRRQAFKRAEWAFREFEAEAARSSVKVECVLAEGEASEALVRMADENGVDLLILGVRKKGPVARAFLGSTAEPVIRAAHVPVLSVPMNVEEHHEVYQRAEDRALDHMIREHDQEHAIVENIEDCVRQAKVSEFAFQADRLSSALRPEEA